MAIVFLALGQKASSDHSPQLYDVVREGQGHDSTSTTDHPEPDPCSAVPYGEGPPCQGSGKVIAVGSGKVIAPTGQTGTAVSTPQWCRFRLAVSPIGSNDVAFPVRAS